MKYIYLGNVQAPEARITKCPNCDTLLIDRIWFGADVKMDGGKCPKCGEIIPGLFEDAINLKDKLDEVPPELSALIKPTTSTPEEKDTTDNESSQKNYIIYATQNGTSKEVAEAIEGQINGYKVCDIQQFTVKQLQDSNNCIFCAATYGRGSPPASAVAFWNELQNISSFSKPINFAVVGLGSSAYRRTFCGFAKSLENKLIELGAKEILPICLRDEQDDECDDSVNEWIDKLKSLL